MLPTMEIHKKVVIDDAGTPQEVIIPWAEFQQIEELLGLDLEPEVAEQLEEAKRDRASGETSAYVSLNDL
jgi:PHD/YefM family antitoxin component YafN of YafNO toxin-antitoxin module